MSKNILIFSQIIKAYKLFNLYQKVIDISINGYEEIKIMKEGKFDKIKTFVYSFYEIGKRKYIILLIL